MNILEVRPSDYHKKLVCNRANILAVTSFLSKSVIWEYAEHGSLHRWRHHPKVVEPTPAIIWGSLVDLKALTPELAKLDLAFSPYDNFRKKEAQEWRDQQEVDKKIVVNKDLVEQAEKAAKVLTETHRGSAEILAKSKRQVIVVGMVGECRMKGLIDLAPEGEDFLTDLKTLRSSAFTKEGMAKEMALRGYHAQMALYLALWNSTFPHDRRERAKLIFQDSSAPYECAVVEISQSDLEAGGFLISTLVQKLVAATKANHWPMAFEEETVITRPTWSSIQEESRLQTLSATQDD